ncbi:unnamed protein product [Blepharisma stoltei]|uniref:Reverse transcriptase n=1 Tax=Blepharisma stoltei TaxID=1481888 RepID=A0AAU9K3V5_9CILI|nr:unnamed protein product [Blepharisma stoltei]
MHIPDSLRGDRLLTIKGVPLKASKDFRYLGYIIQTRRNGTKGLHNSIAKTRASCMAQFGMLASLRDVSIERKATILQACVSTVSVYAKEECGSENMSKPKWDHMERIQRRMARWLLGAPNGTANETALMELGWVSLQGRIAARSLIFRLRCQRSKNWLTRALMFFNVKENLGWQARCAEQLRGYSIEDCLNDQRNQEDRKWALDVQSKIRVTEYTNRECRLCLRRRRWLDYMLICNREPRRWKKAFVP